MVKILVLAVLLSGIPGPGRRDGLWRPHGVQYLQARRTTTRGILGVWKLKEGPLTYAVFVGKDEVRIFEDTMVDIAASTPAKSPAELVLLSFTTEAASCPVEYRVLDCKRFNPCHLSEVFGCEENPTVSGTSSQWVISFPRLGGYVYGNGAVTTHE